ncbi:MAG: preprotein translocase subunit SecA [Bacteroidia bacterium]|nr:preprotein translocase subunit SecA [Bacteroidia bacterium]MCZ2247960.1 preprotein translocase subunit SecA [Bacteroidia bacterium]
MLDFINKTLSDIFGKKSDRDIKAIQPIVDKIHAAHAQIEKLSNDELRKKSAELKKQIAQAIEADEEKINQLKTKADTNDEIDVNEKEAIYTQIDLLKKEIKKKIQLELDIILPDAFALIKETAKRFTENEELIVTANPMDRDLAARKNNVIIKDDKAIYKNQWMAAGNMVTWDMVHYDVQLIGGIVLHQGKIAEMATGEGKTLVATLPVFLNALSGKGLHVVTVNNYLSRRDSEWMAPLFEFHGLTIDCIDLHEPNSDERRKAYLADITYGTNNEFGFDYLRDNMSRSPEELVQREHNYAIVDEVDSVLIDDARTPLIISGPTAKGDTHEFQALKPQVEKLVNAQRNYINITLAEAKKFFAENKMEEAGMALLRCFRGLPKNKALIKFLSENGVRAQLQKTENFYMQDHGKQMYKVDAELFFVIDEKNNSIELTDKGIELVSKTAEDAKFFVLPDIGSEIAEIEKSSMNTEEKLAKKEILMRDFSVASERVHTVNQLLKAYTLFERDVEYIVMENKIKIVDEQTGRVLDGRRYSDGLHQAIEAKENVKIEASTQTFATITLQNYFRMYNKLAGMTGTAETEAGEFWDIYKLDCVVIPTNKKIARLDREDLVYKTKREKYNAVIDTIVKETENGRPVLVGTTSVEISELLSRMLKLKNIKHNVLNAKLHQREAEIVAEAGKAGTVTIATNMAGRGTDIKLGPGVKEAGGLAIIGTERHDSRRVDRQLRGRAGRQGDPGSSQFFVSLEDDLMRLFGSERIAKMMDKMGIEEGEVIQHSMISKSIERAQKKVEENNFGIRKRLLEYDDVMNSQREVIYGKRRHALFGERLSIDIANTMYDVCADIVKEHSEAKNFDTFNLELIKTFSIESPVSQEEFLKGNKDVEQIVFDKAYSSFLQKSKQIASSAYPVIKNVYENSAHLYENIVVPFTDGIKTMQVLANLKKAYETQGKELVTAFEKGIILAIIDEAWKEHLREMDELKQSVQNAVYEQKDPLLIYKFEAFELFQLLINKVNQDITSFLIKAHLPQENQQQVREVQAPKSEPMPQYQTNRTDEVDLKSGSNPKGGEAERPKPQPIRVEKTVGRNDPCPCGSGKKFKQCHGAA